MCTSSPFRRRAPEVAPARGDYLVKLRAIAQPLVVESRCGQLAEARLVLGVHELWRDQRTHKELGSEKQFARALLILRVVICHYPVLRWVHEGARSGRELA